MRAKFIVPQLAPTSKAHDPERRCEAACLATQNMSGFPNANQAADIIMHRMVDPDCAHCAPYPRPTPYNVWDLMTTIIYRAYNLGYDAKAKEDPK